MQKLYGKGGKEIPALLFVWAICPAEGPCVKNITK